ncbi:hypothetical protein MKY96_17055 [Paenibacillus sp. FSL R7-0302]|uniref:hypothetical protein n=1 Tax=Paenibacillus sp. FSL R7-0302 TaxID=2921681 RepID=UPI0030F7CCEE
MSYLKIDIKRLITSKMVLVVVLILLSIAIVDPLTVFRYFSKHVNLAESIGQNPFQFWMLMNSVSWGNNLYNIMFWIFAGLLTGLIYYDDKNSSMYLYSIIRKTKIKYLISKILSVGLLSFVLLLLVLEINVFVTYVIFNDGSVTTDSYNRLAPHVGHFAYKAYLSSPFKMVQIYTFLNAIAISIFVVFSLCINMLFNFSNRYVALLIPIISLYGFNFIFDSYPVLFKYNIRMILQPRAASAITTIITWNDVFIVFGSWILLNIILIFIVFFKARDCYE